MVPGLLSPWALVMPYKVQVLHQGCSHHHCINLFHRLFPLECISSCLMPGHCLLPITITPLAPLPLPCPALAPG